MYKRPEIVLEAEKCGYELKVAKYYNGLEVVMVAGTMEIHATYTLKQKKELIKFLTKKEER